MNLRIENIKKNFIDLERLEKINIEAIPEEERIEVAELIAMAKTGLIDLMAVYDETEFVGFFVMLRSRKIAYLFFLAIDQQHRSKGYGSQVLAELNKMYADFQVVLDLEMEDENAGNSEQRKRRKSFYLRNGYHKTGYNLSYFGMTFEILCSDNSFSKEDFMELLQKIQVEGFEPLIYPKKISSNTLS